MTHLLHRPSGLRIQINAIHGRWAGTIPEPWDPHQQVEKVLGLFFKGPLLEKPWEWQSSIKSHLAGIGPGMGSTYTSPQSPLSGPEGREDQMPCWWGVGVPDRWPKGIFPVEWKQG